MISIRSARPEDAASIARVHVEGWHTTYRGIVPDEYLAGLKIEERTIRWGEILRSSSRVLVAEQDAKVTGFVSGGAIREPVGRCDAELYAIYLDALVRRKGVGTALVRELPNELDGDGFESMAVWVLEANAATGFYERSGAVRTAGKEIKIGGVALAAIAYVWPSIRALKSLRPEPAE